MIGIHIDLEKRAQSENPIRFGIVGCGQMGVDIVSQVSRMNGLEVSAVADLMPHRAFDAYETAGYPRERIVQSSDPGEAADAIRRGKFVVSDSADLLPRIGPIETIVDATGLPEAGAAIALDCFSNGKHLVMMNVEADVTVGPVLRRKAEQAGVLYTLAAGDEPAALMELYDFARALGLEIVAAGKGKNNPMRRDVTPEECAEEAERRGLNPYMLVEFIDGSKTMVEMAAVANATGLVPDVPDMHGPKTTVSELKKIFSLQQDGGILTRKGVVDYAVGGVAPGVFLNVTTDHPRLRQCLALRDMGPGPVYTLFRPFHLCSMEVPLTVAAVSIYGRAAMQPLDRPSAEVTTVAKRDLKRGDILDRIGGRTHRAGCLVYDEACRIDALPVGLAQGCKVLEEIPRGTLIQTRMVEPLRNSLLYHLRCEQDQLAAVRV